MTRVSQTSPPRCSGPACSPITACGVIRSPPCVKRAGGRSRSTRPATDGAPVRGAASPWTSAHRRPFRSWTQPAFAPVVVGGTSWGGFVAPRIAMLAPERPSGIALFDTSAERGTPFERIRATLLTKLLAIGPLDKMTARMIVSGLLTPNTQRREPQLGAELAEQFLTWDRRRFIATVRSVLVDRDPGLDALPRLKVPALIVSGKEDHTLPSFHSQRMAQKLPNARHIEVSGAAHLVPLEAPDEANRLILDFLQDLPGHSELQPGAVLNQRPERGRLRQTPQPDPGGSHERRTSSPDDHARQPARAHLTGP